MPVPDILLAGTLLTLAAVQPPQAGTTGVNLCPFVKPAEINVLPSTKEVHFDTTKTLAEIQAKDVDTIDPYGFHGVTTKQAYMEGSVKMAPSVKLDNKFDPKTGAVCIWYDKIDILIEITPTIVIAREAYNDPCMRKAVIEHEMKHVNVDRQIVNKYAKVMGEKVYNTLAERGFRAQPVSRENAPAMAERMQKVVFQVLEHEYKKFDLERTEAQRAVDNIDEYEGMSARCPNYQKKTGAWATSPQMRSR